MNHIAPTHCCSLLVLATACGAEIGGTGPEASHHPFGLTDGAERAVLAAGDETLEVAADGTFGVHRPHHPGLRLVQRDGFGPFFVRTAPNPELGIPAGDFPGRDWSCEHRIASASDDLAGIAWLGCSLDHPDITGDFDLYVLFSILADRSGETDVEMWIDSRLNVGIDRFRYVMRTDPTGLPRSADDLYVMFGTDELIQNPFEKLAPSRWDLHNAFVWQAIVRDGQSGRALFRNRLKTTSAMSIHTPDWDLLFFSTDEDNADPGWLLFGANPDDEGVQSIELGYELRLPLSVLPGNGGGLLRIGPTLRGVQFHSDRDPARAWWEAAERYRRHLEEETDLLPAEPLHESPYPAAWARDCLYAAWSVSPTGAPINVEAFVEELTDVAAHYRPLLEPDQPLRFCPLLWGIYSYAPYEIRPNGRQLLETLHAAAGELGVELHPGAYYLPWVISLERAQRVGHPILEALVRDLNGNPIAGGDEPGAVIVREGHPATQAEMARALREGYDIGIHWAYHDNPFGEWFTDPAGMGGPHRRLHAENGEMIQMMADTLTELGGGLVVIEQGRLGLNAMQAGVGTPGQHMYLGSTPVPFADAVAHGRHLTGLAGDIVGEPLAFYYADAANDDVARQLCGGCAIDPGVPDNLRHIPRLVIDGVVHGRAVVDPFPNWRRANALPEYNEVLRRSHALRMRVQALQTGRMLEPPETDAGTTTLGVRLSWLEGRNQRVSPKVGRREVTQIPTALYEDLENPGQLVLVLGNPYREDRIVTVYLDPAIYPTLDAGSVAEAQVGQLEPQAAPNTLTVAIAGLDFAVVTLR